MFRCQFCDKSSQLHEQPVRVPVEFRHRSYMRYERLDGTFDYGGDGHEIVREVLVHKACEPLVAVTPLPPIVHTVRQDDFEDEDETAEYDYKY